MEDRNGSGDPATDVSVVVAEEALGAAFGKDYTRVGKLLATIDTARFVEREMPTAPLFPSRKHLHLAALKMRRVEGLVLEFGVASGRSINFLAEQIPAETVFGFDGFEGLPEDWLATYKKGHFAQQLPDVRSNVELVVGWFDKTLPGFVASHPGAVSYLHVDCDLYSSTKTIFDLLGDRIRPGTVIVFDEYFNYPSWQQHEHKAFMELVAARKLRYRFIGAVRSKTQAAVVIEGVG